DVCSSDLADPGVGPHPQEARVVGPAAHAIVAGAEAAADDHGKLRYPGAGHGGDQLGAMLGNAARLVFLTDHEAGDVLQKYQRDGALAGQLDEMRALLRRLGKQDAVVRQYGDRVTVQVGEGADQGRAEQGLELVRSEEHTSELQSRENLVCRLLLEKKKNYY